MNYEIKNDTANLLILKGFSSFYGLEGKFNTKAMLFILNSYNMKDINNKINKMAQPYRLAFRDFFKSSLCNEKGEISRTEKTRLAKYLKQSESQVEKIVYYGIGGFNPLMATFEYCLEKKSSVAVKMFKNALFSIRKKYMVNETDERWFKIPQKKRNFYIAVIESAEKLEKEILR